jgi:hypothetical protein
MSSFAGIPFKVSPSDGKWFPTIELDDDGKYTYQCRAWIATLSQRESLASWVSIVTFRRPLGTIAIIGHMEAGKGQATLSVPEAAGALKAHTAILTGMKSVTAYGALSDRGFMADLEFVILSDPWS